MTTIREAATQALEAMESADFDPHSSDAIYKAITALKAALAEPQSTHSTECYQWHHKCAVAEVQRLRAEMEEIDSDGWRCGVYKMPDLPLAEPVQEPVACHVFNVTVTGSLHEWEPTTFAFALRDGKHALYTSPPQRKPLTEEEIKQIVREATAGSAIRRDGSTSHRIARAIERAHGIGGQQ